MPLNTFTFHTVHAVDCCNAAAAVNEHRGHMEGALMDLIHARFFDGADITGQPAVRRVVVSEGDRDDELQFAARIMMPLERVGLSCFGAHVYD